MENRRENGWEWCLIERERERKKWWGPQVFSPPPFKIQSLQIGKKIGMKNEKNIWTKLPPPLLTFLAHFFSVLFFFGLFISLITLAFCFFVFFFLFFVFVRTWWVFLFLLILFYFFFFLRKHFWIIFMLFFKMSAFIYTQLFFKV